MSGLLVRGNDTPVLIKKKESEANEIFVILKRKFEKGFTDTGDWNKVDLNKWITNSKTSKKNCFEQENNL